MFFCIWVLIWLLVQILNDELQIKLDTSGKELNDTKGKMKSAYGELERLSNELQNSRLQHGLQETKMNELVKDKRFVWLRDILLVNDWPFH